MHGVPRGRAGGGGEGEGRAPPLRVSNLRVVELSENTGDSSRILGIGGAFFGSRSIFDQVMRGQMSNFVCLVCLDLFCLVLSLSLSCLDHKDVILC